MTSVEEGLFYFVDGGHVPVFHKLHDGLVAKGVGGIPNTIPKDDSTTAYQALHLR
jgi:hypothetical protein